ncbi:Uncharacterized protein OS=Pedosphaera parvula (strain Ellin514) GN=Cflav_PD2785 PE=4 SV=1 [Gemmataceae bacterium]|nr:Uncharacterized protein OS=Pedosphaera parvula (strain Ellin514) GN=Cflav_PD2785 PE=4 SV=1 [Gemmataceae bacterium]VTT97158.1 Uncharacterized protein OS=Pedosphaera parvula (strain Ellin514) GN=Cflav_PD2785 PE=4 SV=1 [Gemmataceae bacterium]
MLGRFLTKLRNSYRRRGAVGTVRNTLRRAVQALKEMTPAGRRFSRRREESDRDFDTRFGVDTGGLIQLNQFQIPSEAWAFGNPYGAIHPDDFARLLGVLPVRHNEFTFVDYGSGKGRAVLLASERPFKKVVGVEFAPELDRIAHHNLGKFPAERRRCEVELVCGDALEYELPDGPLVCYFYNPFGREIMEGVVARIEESYRRNPREIYVLYANPLESAAWDKATSFRKLAHNGDYALYRADPAAVPQHYSEPLAAHGA